MQLQLIPISSGIPERIHDLYESSFPLNERRPWKQQELLVSQNKLQLKELQIENHFSGFIFYWQLSNSIFIEHFAIDVSARGKGAGTKVMQLLASTFTSIVLETEPEEKSEDAKRRISFYEKLGYKKFPFFYEQPPYRNGHPFQKMDLMHNLGQTSKNIFDALKKEIYEKVYGIFS